MSRTPHPPPVTDRTLPVLLAVYGTLRRGCRNHHLLAAADPVVDGQVVGELHEITAPLGRAYSYPLLVVPAQGVQPGPGRVQVEVYRVGDADTLRALDALEAYDPDAPEASEYVRVRVSLLPNAPVTATADTRRTVQVYAYAGHPDGQGPVVRGGDWSAHAGHLA